MGRQNDRLNVMLFKIEKAKKPWDALAESEQVKNHPEILVMSSGFCLAFSILCLFLSANLPHGRKPNFQTWGTAILY